MNILCQFYHSNVQGVIRCRSNNVYPEERKNERTNTVDGRPKKVTPLPTLSGGN